jgi:hypothetical protein
MKGSAAMANAIHAEMIQPRGRGYRDDQIVPHSHYRQPIDRSPGRLAGHSRIWGDASPEVQSRVIDGLIEASRDAGLDARQTALVLAIVRVESGFNPDAAAGTTSAFGLGQFIDRTGAAYGIDDTNRHDVALQSRAVVAHCIDNMRLARSRGQGEEHVYKYHHDGPTRDYGGLALSNREVMPYLDRYERFVLERPQLTERIAPVRAAHDPSLDEPAHPAFALYAGALNGIAALNARFGIENDPRGANTAGALAHAAHAAGLQRIDHVVLGHDASRMFAVEGELDSLTKRYVSVDTAQARAQSVEESSRRIDATLAGTPRPDAQMQTMAERVESPVMQPRIV